MFLGEVVEIHHDDTKSPLLYSQRKYWNRGNLIEKQPLLYVACTIRSDQLRLDGRLQGVVNHPQKIALRLLHQNKVVLTETADTDEFGYFELIRSANSTPSKGIYLTEASWSNLTGKASSTF